MENILKMNKFKDNNRSEYFKICYVERDSNFEEIRDKPLSVDTSPYTEVRSLVNWKRWLEDRKNLSYRIESITGRSQADQHWHNSPEEFRSLIEMRNLMEQAAAPMVTDQYRGGPEFWQIPESLPDHGITCRPKIPLTLTKRDLRLPMDLMHVGLPDLTMKERNLDRLKAKEEHWKRNKYLKTRKLELTKEIALLTPKELEIAELSVQGHALFRGEKREPRIPLISIEHCDDNDDTEDIDQMTILKIQEREFIWKEAVRKTTEPVVIVDTDSQIIWSLIFTGEIGERIEREIVLENKGTRVIVYHWRDWSFQPSNMSFEIRCSSFFFNKTKGLILPGQIVTIKVWCRSSRRGIFTESWRLITEPELSTSAFVFRFWSGVIDSHNVELAYYRRIDEYLDLRVRNSMIRSILEELMERFGQERETPTEPIYEVSLRQNELFNSLNPNYFYCPSIMIQLQEIYYNVTDESTSPWNLSLNILREIISQIGETDYRHDVLVRFNDLCKKCLRSNPDTIARTKYNIVYNVLCAFANIFENESEFAKTNSLLEEPVILIEVHKAKSKSSRSRQIYSPKPVVKTQDLQARKKKEINELKLQLYREIFFRRIYKALGKAIVQACTIIDSLQT